MDEVEALRKRRNDVLARMGEIGFMRRGTINEQYFPVIRQGKKTSRKRGPYYVFSRSEGGKTVSRRLTTPEQLQQARADIAAHQHFVALCQQFEELTERLGQMEREQTPLEQEKKRPRSRSKQTAR